MSLTARQLIAGLGKPVSELALGTAFYNMSMREESFALLDAFVERGGTLVDSGRVYGESEAVLGEWMRTRGIREQVAVITKCGHGTDHRLPAANFEEMVSEELETSMRLLKTEYVDLYMLHRDNPEIPVDRIMNRLNREIDAGRVRTIGASNWTYDRIDAAQSYAARYGMHGFSAVSNNLSLAAPAAAFYPGLVTTDPAGERWHRQSGVLLVAWSAQARGFFSGRYGPVIRADGSRELDSFAKRMIEVYGTDENHERLRRAEDLGRPRGYTAVEVALAWVLHKPFPVVPIVGPRTVDELRSCVKALSLKLTPAEIRWLERI